MRRIPHFDSIVRNFVGHSQATSWGYKTDDGSFGPALARALEQFLTTELEVPLEELPMTQGTVVDIATDIDQWAETFSYRIIDGFGVAEFFNAYANTSMPLVTLSDDEVVRPVKQIELGYQLSRVDMAREGLAAQNGRPMRLQPRMNTKAVRGMMEKNEDVATFGDAARKLHGFANHPNVPILARSGADWLTAAGTVIVDDLTNMLQAVRDNTFCTERPDGVALPESVMTNLNKRDYVTAAPTASSDRSIMSVIRERFPEFTFSSMCRLQSNRSFGNLSQSRAIMYKRDQEAVRLVYPMRPTFFDQQWEGHLMTVPGMARIGGIDWRKPLTAEYMDVSA